MRISILTLFPEMFNGPFSASIIHRAITAKKITIDFINIRDFAIDTHKSVDDHPYGGGAGMVLRVDIIDKALSKVKSSFDSVYTEHSRSAQDRKTGKKKERIILLDPGGKQYTQAKARQCAKLEHLILICGHYEGIDERVRSLVDESLSIGPYVLTGGEIPAMVITDSVVRLLSGVLKKPEATIMESFSKYIIHSNTKRPYREYPQYTRPEKYNGKHVPSVLLSGDHKKITEWQEKQALRRSRKR